MAALDILSVNFKNALDEWEEQISFSRKRPVTFLEKVRANKRTIFWMVIFHLGLIWAAVYYYIITRARLASVLGFGLTGARLAAAMHRYCFAMILFTVAHRSTRFVRRLFRNKWIPWSEWKLFHKVMGYWIMIASLLHIGCHFYNMDLISKVPADPLNCALERPIPNGAETDANATTLYHADCCFLFPTQVDCCPVTCPDPRPGNESAYVCAVGSRVQDTCSNNIDDFLPGPIDTFRFGYGEPVIFYRAERQYSQLFLHLGGLWGWTGWALAFMLFSLWLFTYPALKRKYFEAFWLSHMQYPLIYILQLVHGAENLLQNPEFWFWTLPVMIIYTVEKAFAIYSRRASYPVKQAELYPSKFGEAIRVTINKPYGFSYAPGEWVWMQVPEISKFEWHPVAICSTSEDEDHIDIVFQRLGDWTDELYNMFRRHATKQDGRQVTVGVQGLVPDTVKGSRRKLAMQPTIAARGLAPRNLTLRQMAPLTTNSAPGNSDPAAVDQFAKFLDAAGVQNSRQIAQHMVKIGLSYDRIFQYQESDFEFLEDSARKLLMDHLNSEKEIRTDRVKVDNVIAHIRLDGPYGSYGEDAFNFETVMLFGGGVGVTPMISVLQTIRKYVLAGKPMKIRKVRFYWTVRDRSQFSWVREDIIECRRDLKDMLEVRMYETRNSDLVKVQLDHEFNIFSGRLPLDQIYQDTINAEREYAQEVGRSGRQTVVGVFATGPPTITEALEYSAVQNQAADVKFIYRLVE
eukprot:81947_1